MRGSNTVGGFLIVLITFDRICSTHKKRFIPYNLCLYDIQELDYKMFKKVIDEINVMDYTLQNRLIVLSKTIALEDVNTANYLAML